MLPDQIQQEIIRVEERYAVSSWSIDGVEVWPLIRIYNYALLSEEAFGNTESRLSKSLKIKRFLSGLLRSYLNPLKDLSANEITKKSDLVFLSDGVSFTKIQKKYYDKFCDPLIEVARKSHISTRMFTLGNNLLVPRYSPSEFIQRQIDFVIIKSLLHSKVKDETNDIKLSGYLDFINDADFTNLAYKPSISALLSRVKKIKSLVIYYTNKLKDSGAKAAFIVSYYHDAGFAFIMACRNAGIRVIDLQHGVQGHYHMSYGSWTNVPQKGFQQLPDEFWVWDKNDAEAINSWSKNIENHKAIEVGNPFLELWKKPLNNSYVEEYVNKAKTIFNNDRFTILLTLSPGADSEIMLGDSWGFVKQTQAKYNWMIRLHPNMMSDLEKWRAYLSGLDITNINILEASEYPLYAVFKVVDLHLTAQSTTVIEADKFNVPTIVTSDFGHMLFKQSISEDRFFLAKTFEEMKNVSEHIRSKSSKMADEEISESGIIGREIQRLIKGVV